MKKLIFCTCILAWLSSVVFAQQIKVKDAQNNILMQVNDEGTVGSVTLLPFTSIPGSMTNKLYNVNGSLYWNNNSLGLGGWSLVGNSGTSPGAHFLGTTDNEALELKINNSRVFRFEPASGSPYGFSPNVIGGYFGNKITSNVVGATIGGGGSSSYINQVSAHMGTISGGWENTVNGNYGAIGGGKHNTSGGNATVAGGAVNIASGEYSTVGGGFENEATALYSSVNGGNDNNSTARAATVAGGEGNIASGIRSFIAGGSYNTTAGESSFATGRKAKINTGHNGAILFSGSDDYDFNSTAANEFAVRATGGVRFVTAIDGSGNPTKTVSIDNTAKITTPSLQVTGGTLSAGKVLTSDANGNATWQNPTGGGTSLDNISYGQANKSGDGTNAMDFSISFGKTYSSAPIVVATLQGGLDGDEQGSATVVNATTTGATLRIFRRAGVFYSWETYRVNWIAIGTL